MPKDGGSMDEFNWSTKWCYGHLWTWNGGNWHQWNNDRVNGDYWYIYKGPNFYVSSNGGLTWKLTNNIGWYQNAQPYVRADFGKEGHVCVALGDAGILCSVDYGQTFENVKGFNKSRIVTFGRSKENKTKSIKYYFGIGQQDVDNG